MTTYKYTDATNEVVHVIDDDGISRMSMLASALPPDTVIEPADPVPLPAPPPELAQITVPEWNELCTAAGCTDLLK